MTCNICLLLYVHILLAETGYQCLITKMMYLGSVYSSCVYSTQSGLRVTEVASGAALLMLLQ